ARSNFGKQRSRCRAALDMITYQTQLPCRSPAAHTRRKRYGGCAAIGGRESERRVPMPRHRADGSAAPGVSQLLDPAERDGCRRRQQPRGRSHGSGASTCSSTTRAAGSSVRWNGRAGGPGEPRRAASPGQLPPVGIPETMPLWTAAVAALLIFVILWDAFQTIILSRRVSRKFRPTRAFYRVLWTPWRAAAKRVPQGNRRENVLTV